MALDTLGGEDWFLHLAPALVMIATALALFGVDALDPDSTNHRAVFFGDGTLSQWDVRNETLVGQSNARFEGVAQSIDRGVLYSHLLLYDIEFERTVRRQGRTALVYDVTDAYNRTISNTYGTATDATGHVVVAADGRVLEIETTVTYSKGTLRYHYTHRRLGETDVMRPGWLRDT